MKNLLIITQKVDEKDQLLGFFIDWINHFAQKFEKVTIFCLEKGTFELPGNVEVISLGKDRGSGKLKILSTFYSLLFTRRNDYNAVLVHMNPIWVVLGGFWWRMMNKKIFMWYTHKSVTAKLKLAEKFADTIFTASSESFRLPSKKVIVTGHGIDTELFKPSGHRQTTGGREVKILSVGRISPVKNYEILISAAQMLSDRGVNFLITMIGEAPLEKDKNYDESLKSKIKSLGLEGNFNFVGKVKHKDLPAHYQSHDIFVHLSKTGSVDKALLEAMACGMAVLSSSDSARVFLPPELFIQGESPDLIADMIIKISSSGYNTDKLREYVVKNHSLPALMEKISRIINDTVSKKRKILISGYTYVDGGTIKTFDYYPGKNDVYFLVPYMWPIKGGKYIYRPLKQKNVRTAKAFFYHSKYSVIGGVLKGWMPIFPFVLIKQKPDVVFSASELNLLTTLYQGIFAKLFNAKHIIFTWENVSYKSKFLGFKGIIQKFIVKLNILFCDGFVCGTVRAQKIIGSLTDKPIAVIPLSGIDTEFLSRDYSKKSFRGMDFSDYIVFCFVGAIGYRKGIHLIIKAFEEISKTLTNVRLLIAGSGEYEQEIDSIIKRAELSDLITRFSWLEREEVRDILNSSDLFLYPSIPYGGWEEQFGYSLLEASSMELPVITTESGSISEVVLNGKTGMLVKPDDYTALKEAMLNLANDKEKRISIGKAGRQFVRDNYSHEIVAKKYYQFFNGI